MQQSHAKWFAVHTKPRQERIALENLERQGFHCFLPMAVNPYQRLTVREPRVEPLFPRYLFLRAVSDRQSLGPVRSTRGVMNLVRFGIRLATISGKAIESIQDRSDPETGLVQLDPVPVDIGDTVRVFDGPFAGIEGIFKERKGDKRALLMMRMLGEEATVEVDALLLQKVG